MMNIFATCKVNGCTFTLCRHSTVVSIFYDFLISISRQSGSSRNAKTFLMHNSAEHEILNAHRYKIIKKFSFFSGSDEPRMLFLMLNNVKMLRIVGIL